MRRKVTPLLSISIFLFLAASFSVHVYRDLLPSAASSPSPVASINPTTTLTRPIDRLYNHAVRETILSVPLLRSLPTESILLPDWEVLVLLPFNASSFAGRHGRPSCVFHNGATSRARRAGYAAFRCFLPNSLRGIRPFYTPRLSWPSFPASRLGGQEEPWREMLRSTRLAYDSVSTDDDVIVFAKGINRRPGASLPAPGLRCVFIPASGGAAVAATSATSSAQEVFRCPHPPASEVSGIGPVRVSLSTAPEAAPIHSVANYRQPRGPSSGGGKVARGRSSVCACTMVYNVAKFLPEWVSYHAAVGVERFFLYDNGSDDELEPAVRRLGSKGFNVTTRFWPWPKTQEAGFSHCAAVNRDQCEWMAFLDVDEFVFSPAWADSDRPDRFMVGSLVAVGPEVGQVTLRCMEFGPSGQRAHPRGGVTQGYTCRMRKDERHKSILRLDAAADSLVNSVHHFELKEGFRTKRVQVGEVMVNHYKYQVWDEFKVKFRRRVSTYVVDWKETTNLGSKDRAPGLGSEAIEPTDWIEMFCEVNDTRLRDTSHKWFAVVGVDGRHRMAWVN